MMEKTQWTWADRHKLCLDFVQRIAQAFAAGLELETGPSPVHMAAPRKRTAAVSPVKVLLCSPHPDDEALTAALPLRLSLEGGAEVVNCAITLGSDKARRPRRREELASSCAVLGFRLIVLNDPHGLVAVSQKTRENYPVEWVEKVDRLTEIFDQERPDVVFLPHVEDFHPAHIGTHLLAVDALKNYLGKEDRGVVTLIETEYWRGLSQPNLMVGVTAEIEAIILVATAEHGGDVARNPYHVRHPARLIDNVRRGSEVVGGVGAAAPTFAFAELYRVSFMKGERIIPSRPGGRTLLPTEPIDVSALRNDFYPEDEGRLEHILP